MHHDNDLPPEAEEVIGRLWLEIGTVDDRLNRIERRLGWLLFLNGIASGALAALLALTWP